MSARSRDVICVATSIAAVVIVIIHHHKVTKISGSSGNCVFRLRMIPVIRGTVVRGTPWHAKSPNGIQDIQDIQDIPVIGFGFVSLGVCLT